MRAVGAAMVLEVVDEEGETQEIGMKDVARPHPHAHPRCRLHPNRRWQQHHHRQYR